jgi:S-adenosylmethionine hydrolase
LDPSLPESPVTIPYRKASLENGRLTGTIYILDVEYGNIWTDIGEELFKKAGLRYGDNLHLVIYHQGNQVYDGDIPYCRTFADVESGKPLAYLNGSMQLSFALNRENFARTYLISAGNEWTVEVTISR